MRFKKLEDTNQGNLKPDDISFNIYNLNENKKLKIKLLIYYIISLAIAILFYELSLISCTLTYEKCFVFFRKRIYSLFFFIFIFSVLLFISNLIAIKFKHYIVVIVNTVVILILYFSNYNFNKIKHGAFSIIISLLLFIIFTIKYFILKLIIVCYKKNRKYTILTLIFITFFYFIWIMIKIIIDNKSFYYGFNGKHLINNGVLCHFNKFYINYYETFGFIFSFTKYIEAPFRIKLDLFNDICKDCEYFSYPKPQDVKRESLYFIDYFQQETLKNILPYTSEKSMKEEKNREIFIKIDRKKNNGEVIYRPVIDDTKFETKINSLNKDKKNYNVINFFIDAISREKFFRIFPKTRKFIEEYYFKDSKDKKGYGYQFFRAHSLEPWTAPNWWAYRYGTPVLSKNRYSLNDIFKKNGYETANFFGSCSFYENFIFYKNLKVLPEQSIMTDQTFYDHDSTNFYCDPNYYMNDGFNIFIGQYSIFRKKIYNKRPYEYNFDFSIKLMEKLKEKNKEKNSNVPFFQDLYFVDAHEYSQSVIEYMDDSFYKYFIYLKDNGYLNNTILTIFSDHGNHMNPLLGTTSGSIERSNPMLFFLLPKEVNEKYGENLKKNEQKLITLGDVHKAFYQFVGGEDNRSLDYYQDIFNNVIKDTRYCSDININSFYCYCLNPNNK